MRNFAFSEKVRSEQNLFEDIIIESLKIYGQDLYYLPRDIVNEDTIFGQDVPSSFNSSYRIEMYIENIEGFEGEGDLFTRFGVEIRDEATFVVSRRRWRQTVDKYDNDITGDRQREGDLIFLPLTTQNFAGSSSVSIFFSNTFQSHIESATFAIAYLYPTLSKDKMFLASFIISPC